MEFADTVLIYALLTTDPQMCVSLSSKPAGHNVIHLIILNQFAGGYANVNLRHATLSTAQIPIMLYYQLAGCQTRVTSRKSSCSPALLSSRQIVDRLAFLDEVCLSSGDRCTWSCWNSWSPDGLQLYGLLLVTGAAASHTCSWLRLL